MPAVIGASPAAVALGLPPGLGLPVAVPPAPLAHGPTGARAWSDLALVVSLALLCAGYARGVHELWHRRGLGAVVPRWRAVAFGLGVAAILAALTGPVHERAERSFAGHMAQHMILLVVAGPLLAAGAAGLPLALAAPRRLRRRWARWRGARVGTWLRRPGRLAVTAALAHAGALWAWHLPAGYRLAERDELAHAVEHASFVGTALLLWSLVWGARRQRLPGPVAVLLLFATMLAASALGAALTLASAPIYPGDVLARYGGDPLADQQRAGLVMWIPMDVVVLAAAVALFLRWLSRLDRAAPAGRDLLPPAAPPVRSTARSSAGRETPR
ncbi:cytochrome c oxidase assembly protein [Micromonospora sp. NPDC049559]|uniref:cytochrome c oxidase assembly protein n=1 Tax=Micromonospora sp. NPDC049559 TaxID=3155923 RepID=UPI003420BEA6